MHTSRHAVVAMPSSKKRSVLPEEDYSTFFRVLRYVSAQSATGRSTPTPPLSRPLSQVVAGRTLDRDATPPTHSLSKRGSMGVSSSASNRAVIPEFVLEPLEDYRMAFTNLPVKMEELGHTREVLRTVLLEAYKDDSDTVQALFVPEPPASAVSASPPVAGPSCVNMQSMQEVLPGLWCGSYHPAANKALLKEHGITHICCCIGTAPRFPSDFMYLTIPADDRSDYNISQFFGRTFEFIENALIKSGGGVLVHCGAGISRAPTITAAYLIRKMRITSAAAVRLVQSRRPFASPNMGFRKQLKELAIRLRIQEDSAVASAEDASTGSQIALEAIAHSEAQGH